MSETQLSDAAKADSQVGQFESSVNPIFVHQGGQIQFANAAAVALVQRPEGESLRGQRLSDLFQYDDPEQARKPEEALPVRTWPSDGVVHCRTRDNGASVTLTMVQTPFLFQGVNATLAIAHRRIDRAEEETELERTRSLLMAAIQSSPAGILVADAPSGHIRIANSAAFGIRGDTSEPLTEIPIENHPAKWQCFHPDGSEYRPEDLPLSRALLNGETVRNVDVLIRRQGGETRWVLGNAAPVKNKNGDVTAAVVVFPDVTEQRRADKALREAHQDLELRVAKRTEELSAALRRIEESERTLNAILNNTTLMVGMMLPTGKLLRVNQAMARAAGATEQSMQGLAIWDAPWWMDDITRDRVRNMVQEAARGAYVRDDIPYHAPDGRFRSSVFSISPVRDRDGHVRLLIPEAVDISDQKETERRLRESQERYQRLVGDVDPDYVVFEVGVDRIVQFTSACDHLLGVSSDQVVGHSWRDFIAPADSLDKGLDAIEKCIAGITPEPYELRMRNRITGHWCTLEFRQRPVVDSSGKVIRIEGVARNVTQYREAMLKMREAKEAAESADRVKSVFLATMSHELRTPLNSIIGFTGILLQGIVGPLNAEQKTQLSMVADSSRHLLELINDVLDISKIDAGELRLRATEFDPCEVIEQAVAMVRTESARKGLSLSVTLPDDRAQLATDRGRFRQILLNLLSNAIKFTPSGEVVVLCRREGDALVTSVADTGIGIGQDDLATIFQPFRQLDCGLNRRSEGTGLGLAISHRLAEMMGGSIEVKSQVGKGTEFTFTVPCSTDESPSAGGKSNVR